ncbi:MAG TPA: hypothetical protein VEW03_07150 [Longimicrobiaceae bacterium]|nr:hypothetical protein [Longimicrobiaceae bacterium]
MNPTEHDDQPTPQERAAFAALPREREPSRLLEERTVRALRERGLVRSTPPRRFRFPVSWMAGAAAAALALFMTGLAAGQYVAGRATARAVVEAQRQDARHPALAVQQAGSAYVSALSRFASVADTAGAAQTAQGREVAVAMLRAAASELVRISPDDPLASGILAALDRTRTQPTTTQADTTGKQRVVWF